MATSLARKATKVAVLPFGLLQRARAGDLVILLYHRVGAGDREIDVTLDAFEHQIRYLAGTGLARDLDACLQDGRGGVVVTVDDGYRDFHSHVLPALVRSGVPAVLYLATDLVVQDGRASGADRLTWSLLDEAVATGLVTVGSHTHTHADLSVADARRAEVEMRRSKELVEDRLGVSCRHFAFPWSVASPEAEGVARRLFDTAALRWCTNRGRFDQYRLGRTPVLRADGAAFFRAKVKGVLDHEASVYRVFRRGPWRRP